METDRLSLLSTEQISSLNDDQKVIYCAMSETDQKFFAHAFTPKDLPTVLDRKGAIMKRDQAGKERLQELQKKFAQIAAENPESSSSEDILTSLAGAVGLGAAVAVVATDNTASWQGVEPYDLIPALKNEFDNDNTRLFVNGDPNALTATVALVSNSSPIPALTIHLSAIENATQVKISELTRQGTIETIKEGGQKLLNIAGNAARVLYRGKRRGVSPGELISTASETLTHGADLAEVAGNLKLKERAWKAIKQTAEAIETNYRSEAEKARKARYALEKAWDNFNNCPTCGVGFEAEDAVCRVCGSSRPEKPIITDPRGI